MKILIAEDDKAFLTGLVGILKETGHEIGTAGGTDAALARLEGVDLLITDVRLPGAGGLTLIVEAKRIRPLVEIIVMTGHGTIRNAVEAMKLGARAYLTKPFEVDEILAHVREVGKLVHLRAAAAGSGRGGLVGSSDAMRRVYTAIDMAAASVASVLISGPTGSGKELAARAVHDASDRAAGPFVAVNLGALPRDLVESELFGAEAGAYTGQKGRRRGRFAVAHRGTLFLDEINSMPLDLQSKLLRSIETRTIWPLGAEKAETIDVRIIAATNDHLERLVAAKTFREDLFYRLHVLTVEMPALDDHLEDIPLIVRALLERKAAGSDSPSTQISGPALGALFQRNWPGNIRELDNVLERAVSRARLDSPEKITIFPTHLEVGSPMDAKKFPFKRAKALAADEWSKRTLREAFAHANGNISLAARNLDMSRTALMSLIKKYGLKAS